MFKFRFSFFPHLPVYCTPHTSAIHTLLYAYMLTRSTSSIPIPSVLPALYNRRRRAAQVGENGQKASTQTRRSNKYHAKRVACLGVFVPFALRHYVRLFHVPIRKGTPATLQFSPSIYEKLMFMPVFSAYYICLSTFRIPAHLVLVHQKFRSAGIEKIPTANFGNPKVK